MSSIHRGLLHQGSSWHGSTFEPELWKTHPCHESILRLSCVDFGWRNMTKQQLRLEELSEGHQRAKHPELKPRRRDLKVEEWHLQVVHLDNLLQRGKLRKRAKACLWSCKSTRVRWGFPWCCRQHHGKPHLMLLIRLTVRRAWESIWMDANEASPVWEKPADITQKHWWHGERTWWSWTGHRFDRDWCRRMSEHDRKWGRTGGWGWGGADRIERLAETNESHRLAPFMPILPCEDESHNSS